MTPPLNLGPYHNLSELGRGGFAVVYKASDSRLKRPVALKVLKGDWLHDPDFVRQFTAEAEIIANLQHPHIIDVYEQGEIEGSRYLAMPYLAGETLAEHLTTAKDQPLPPAERLEILRQLADALDYAHREKVLHQDIKPSNVMLTRRDGRWHVTLMDFGLVRALQGTQYIKRTNGVLGSPEYISPEQADGKPVDHRADLYALGVLAYRLYTGHLPFESETVPTLLYHHVHKAPPAPRLLNPQLERKTERALLKALHKDPAKRFQSGAEFVAALEPNPAPAETTRLPGWVWAVMSLLICAVLSLGALAGYGLLDDEGGLVSVVNTPTATATNTPSPTPTVTNTPRPPTNTPQPSNTPTATPTATATPTITNTPIPSTNTPTPTPTATNTATYTPVPTNTPGLGVGSTRLRSIDGMTQVYVPAGSFMMGSAEDDPQANDDESPLHQVTLDAFWLDRTEVTNEQYEICVNAGVCEPSSRANDADFNGPTQPVVAVSWQDANAYCTWAGGDLPTEAQWEYAARGPDSLVYPWGNQFVGQNLNCSENTCGDSYRYTAPVGSFPAGDSWVGVADMSGNVWEWVSDWYDSNYYANSPTRNPTGTLEGERKVLRGGSWTNIERVTRSAGRNYITPSLRYDSIGFRCRVLPGN